MQPFPAVADPIAKKDEPIGGDPQCLPGFCLIVGKRSVPRIRQKEKVLAGVMTLRRFQQILIHEEDLAEPLLASQLLKTEPLQDVAGRPQGIGQEPRAEVNTGQPAADRAGRIDTDGSPSHAS